MEQNKLTFDQLPSAMSTLLAEVAEISRKLAESQLQVDDRKKPINIEAAADYLDLSVKTLYNMASKKQVPAHKRGSLYFYKDELDHWIKTGDVPEREISKQEAVRGVASKMR